MAGAEMDFCDAGCGDNALDVGRRNTAAGHDDDAAGGNSMKGGDQVEALQA